ncbi:hypothetical protein SAMN04487770_103124 [Butyrivibrio sp. ob235]|uniref:DUF6020 family protein n=1 Tax=Butyrivibrio sp. ob235 TaxID=1761780 RepID=UPI0008C3E62E|nr:DUF6020 family protein [Butyrivibrio sp. ob235]SEK83661.1 hypothetical protein SAMN04487770_103124 [Butyrivibrio sp. ob235]
MRNQKSKNKTWLMPVLFGVGMSLSLVWGYQLETSDHIDIGNIGMLLIFLLLSAVIAAAVKYSWCRLEAGKNKETGGITVITGARTMLQAARRRGYTGEEFFKVWMMLAACNFVVLLGVFPGFFVYDAQTEVIEVLSRSFNTHHPLLHVLLLGGSVAFFHKFTGNYNAGIFFYILCQMLLMTHIFTYYLNFLKKHGAGVKARRIIGAFFGLFPTIVMYTLCSCKDGLFSSFLVLTIVLMLEWEELTGRGEKKKKAWEIIVSAVLMMLFRHNGFYAYIVFALVVMISAKIMREKDRFHRATFLIAPVIIYFCINTAVGAVLSAETGEHQEMLTVPIQQISRVYYYNPENFSGEEKETLHKYLSEEALSHYTPRISDILKMYFDNKAYEEDKASFWKLWAKKGMENPMSYLNGWFLTSYGYWYPGAVINVYQGNTVFTFTYEDSSYFGYEVELPGKRHSAIPFIDAFYRKLSIEKFQQNIPVLSLLFSPAAYFWVFLYLMMTAAVIRRESGMYPWILLGLVWMTVLLGPTYLVRYTVYLWYAVPILIYTVLLHNNDAVEDL